ncbi:hypothetical protein JXI42_05010 [bacterium]|nr:hypothetical protein [bacterium]
MSDPVIWVLSHPGRFTAAVFTGGYWGVALEFLNELTAEAIIALGKQIGEHPEHYTEQVAMDFLEYLVDLDSKWLDMKKRVADGYPLSFSDAIVFQNDHYFDIIYGPPAVDTKREIINNKYQWTDGEKDSFLAAIKILISSSELSSAISTGLFINDLYETAKLFHSPLMEYPPYEHMYTSININYEQAKQSYTKFLENVGLSSQKICELAVLQTHFHKANSFSVNVQSPNLLDEFVSVDGAELQYDHPYGQSAMIGDMIYAISGPSGEESAVSIIESANILPGGGISAWDTVGSIDLRHQAAVAATSENIYIIGGYPTSGRVTRIPIVDGQLQNEISEPYVHAPRYAARAFVHQNYLYIVGGLQDPDSPVPGVERAKIFSNGSLSEWLPAPSLINSRGGFALVKGSQYVWALGGTGDSGLLDSVERAELLSDGGLGEWASGFTSLPEVEFPSAIMIGDCIYFIGSTGNEDQPVYILGLDETMQLSQPFESSKLNFAPRQQPIMFASDTYLYISGGRSNSDTGTDTWRQTERAAFIYNITSGYIGPEGGSISLETGNGLLTVTFPKGAVDHGVNVDLSAKNAFIGLSEGLSIIGNTMHSISCPINLFNERVTIAFPLPEIDSKYSYSVECLGEDEWVDIGGILDPASDTILVAVDHFTDFIVTSVLRDTGSDAEQLHITNNYTPNFEFQTDEAYVFSVKSPVGKPAIADVVAEEMINTLAQYISQGMVEGSVVPGWGTVIGAVSGLLKAMDEKYNPIRIVPLTKTIKINDGLVEAGDLLSNNEVSFLVLLDFLGTEKDKEYIDRYRRGLWFYAENRYGYRIYEMRELLSEDQMRKLDPSKSYIICPKRSVRFFPESYAINASEAFLRTESLWLTKWPTVSLLGKELSFYGRDGQRIRVPLEKTSLPKPEDHQTSKIVQYSSDGDFSAASILARKLNAQIIKTTDIIQLLEYNEWILVGADQANPVYKKVFGQRVTLKDEGYIRIDHEEFLYLGTTYSVWGAASYMAQDTLNSAKWIVEHGWPAQTIRLPWIVVQYSSDADYQAANLIAKQRGWDIIKTSDISDLEEYEGWVIVGAQDANPVFNQVFGPLIDQNDQGYILINEKDYVYQQQNRAVWGIASWSIQDTEESARWVIQWGLPSQSIRQRY